MDLRPLLFHALNDGPVYSAMVPWVLSADSSMDSTWSRQIEQLQLLHNYQLQQADVHPCAMRTCVVQLVQQCCRHAKNLSTDTCPTQPPKQEPKSSHTSKEAASCCLPTPATRLAKLYGHMLAHGLVPDFAEHLQCLTSVLSTGPLQGNGSSSSSSTSTAGRNNARAGHSLLVPTSDKQKANKSSSTQQQQHLKQSFAGSPASAVPKSQQQGQVASQAIICAEDFLCCKTCAAHFAAKVLECCSKLLCCLPVELLQGLAASMHVQLYAKGLAQTLSRTIAAANPTAYGGGLSAMATPGSSSRAYDSTRSPAAAAQQVVGPVGSVLQTPGSALTPSTVTSGSRSAPGRLPVVGLLAPTSASSSAGKGASAGAAGKLTMAVLNNREKCRDLFFSILRKCSSRLDTIRQQQQQQVLVVSSPEGPKYQASAATAAVDTELQDLVSEVGLAAKQLLLQLAPGNQPYLAELFTACVLQAASSGEPILEPQLAMMAVRDPGKFQKLQQRVELTTGRAAARQPAGQMVQQPAGGTPGRSSPAIQLEPRRLSSPAPTSWGGEAAAVGGPPSSGSDGHSQLMRQQQPSATAVETPMHSSLRGTASHSGPATATASYQKRHRPPQQQQQQHILAVLDSSHSQQQRQPPAKQGTPASGPHASGSFEQQQHTPRNAHSTGNSFRLSATTGMNTPLPFAASPGVAASSSGVAAGSWAATPGTLQEAGGSSRTMSRTSNNHHHQHHQQQQRQQTPASAPPTVPVAGSGPPRAAQIHKGLVTPASASQQGNSSSSSSTSHQVVLQLLAELPAGQHVLMLVLHTADSSSFNRSLLHVMLERAHKLLSSCPASFTAAGGLGQHAAALAALASYCSYLAFAAGCSTEHQQISQQQHHHHHLDAMAAAPAASQPGTQSPEGPVLQQQPAVDVSSLLAQALDPATTLRDKASSSDNSSLLDRSWYFALAVPFACRYLTFASFLPFAADSSSVKALVGQLRQVQGLACMSPSHAGFGSLAAAISSMLSSCQQLQQSSAHQSMKQPENAAAAAVAGSGAAITGPAAASAAAAAGPLEALCSVVSQGNSLVDSAYWAVCCPGLQHLAGSLMADHAALQRQQQQQQQRVTATSPAGKGSPCQAESQPSTAKPLLTGCGGPGAAGAANGGRHSSCSTAASPVGTGSSSPAGSAGAPAAAAVRHTTPLLLAPRAPPELSQPPDCIQSALASMTDPLKQQLQQALISQYSTDDMQVKMRDVLALVNGILGANSLSLGLGQGVPEVLQRHLADMEQQVKQQLGPPPAGAAAALGPAMEGQDLARAIHNLCAKYSAPAVLAALESAMQSAAAHAEQTAVSACAALLPSAIPPAAVAAAAALVAASCKANCAQRLLQEVPMLVQAALADRTDELVRLISRQWAVHGRMTAAPGPAAAGAASSGRGGPPAAVTRPVRRLIELTSKSASPSPATAAAAQADASSEVSVGSSKETRRIAPVPVPVPELVKAVSTPDDDAPVCNSSSIAPEAKQQRGTVIQIRQAADSTSVSLRSTRTCVSCSDCVSSDGCGARPAGATGDADTTASAAGGCAAAGLLGGQRAEPLIPEGGHEQAAVGEVQLQQLLQHLQAQLAVAIAGQGICDELPAQMPGVAPRVSQIEQQEGAGDEGQSMVFGKSNTASAPRQQQCSAAGDACDGTLRGVVAAIESTAAVLLAGVDDGRYTLNQLEQRLLASLQETATEQGLAAAATGARPMPHLLQRHALSQLLCGAVLHAFLNDVVQRAVVWGQGGAGTSTGCSPVSLSSSALTTFKVLPSQVMKSVRCDTPQWVLKQLRVWMQGATLGFGRCTM